MAWVENILSVWGTSLLWWAGLCVGFLVLTTLTPCNPGKSWWADRRAAVTDLIYWLVLPLVTSLGRVAFLMLGVVLLYGREPAETEFVARHWPLWCQCLAVLLIQDVILYWVHRLFHRPALWKYHAVHHSPEVLDWTAASRFHPVNAVAEFALADAAVLLMGFSPLALAVLVPFNLIYSAMVHANLNWSFGPLRYVLASPVFHRWHHTSEAEGLDRNFASTFPFLDLAFGTFHMPAGKHPEVYGAGGEPVPRGFLGQTIYPARDGWRWAKRRPVLAGATAAGVFALAVLTWQHMGRIADQEQPRPAVVASAPVEPEPLRLSSNRPPALPTAVAVSAAGGRVLRGYAEGTVILQDMTGRELVRTTHRARANAVALSPNGTIAISASGDGSVRVLSGGEPRLLPHDGQNVMSAAVSDGGWVACGTVDGTVWLWHPDGTLAKKRSLGAGSVHAVAVSEGGRVVVAARQSRVDAWDVAADSVASFDGPRELVYAVAVSGDGGSVVAGGYDGKLFVWGRAIPAPRFVGAEHVGPIYSVAFARDCQSVATGGADRVARVWDAKLGTVTRTLSGSPAPLFAVSMADGRVLGSSKESAAVEWDGRSDSVVPVSGTSAPR